MKKGLALSAICIWIGFIGAISFMEAWLKFRAPGVTLPIGLGIGQLVFAALNKMEWAAFLAAILCLSAEKIKGRMIWIFLISAAAILIVQTSWLLPALNLRAEGYIAGLSMPPSHLHLYYVIAEGLKMITLIALVIALLKQKIQ